MLVQEPVQAAIWHCINNYAFEDATFLAERLCSEVETDEGVFILATCYYRSNQLYQAYWLLYTKKIKSPQCRLLLAQCCYDLKKYSEAEKALNNKHFTQIEHLDYIIEEFGDISCFALKLLAKICTITERHDIATAARIRTLKLNPFLWNTFIDLCNRGGIIDNAASKDNADPDGDDDDENTNSKINESDDDMSSGDYNSNNKLEPNKIFQFKTTDTFLTCQGNNPLSVIWINNNYNNTNNTINNINISNNTNNTININNNNNSNNNNNNSNNSGNNNNNNNNEKTYDDFINRLPTKETTNQNYQYITPNNNTTTKTTLIKNNNYNNMCGDETPLNKQNSINDIDPNWIFGVTPPPDGEKFKYLSTINSITPSFGVLPITNQTSGTTLNDSLIFYSPLPHYQQQQQTTPQQQQQQTTPQQQQLQKTPRNQIDVTPTDQRMPTIQLLKQHHLGKKGKDKIGIIHRNKSIPTGPTPPTPLILSKLFSHTANISPRTPNNVITTTTGSTTTTPITTTTTSTTTTNTLGIGGVRRSSRLFSNNNNNNNFAVKENSNSNNTNTNRNPYILNKFATPRSPPRKTNKRMTKLINLNGNEKITANNEINEKYHQNTNYKNNLHNINNNLINHNIQKIETVTLSENKILNKSTENNLLQPQLQQLILLQQQQQKEALNERIMNLKKQSADGLMSLLRKLANGYVKLSEFNCKEAIEIFQEIPHHHYLSSWVQSQIARAYFEQRNYEMAAKIYQEIHHKEPYRLLGMDIYSTALWHLQREIQLSALAQDLMKLDKKSSPIIWLVSGNCFSLHKEHETAIKFFERAVQIDSDYPYSYTLLGHELAITEELEKGMSCYRTAIVKDLRHYNAWFGMGSIFAKQERYNLAEIHYKRALSINPKNSVILVHIGAMQFFLQKITAAWQSLQLASELDPKNPLCKFHRGSMLFQTGQYAEALSELEELKSIVPKESVVYYLIGKIHKKMNNIDLALMHFSWATDLDPKGTNNQIKDAFDVNIVQNSTGHLTATPITTANVTGAIVTAATAASAISPITTTTTTTTTTSTVATTATRSETPIITIQDETPIISSSVIPSTVTLMTPNPISTTNRTVPSTTTAIATMGSAATLTLDTIIVTATTTMTTPNAVNTTATGNNFRIGSLDVAINTRRRSGNNSGGSASVGPAVSGGSGGISRVIAALAHIDDHLHIRNRGSTNVLTTTSTMPNELNVIPAVTATATARTTTVTTPATAMHSQFLSTVRGYRNLATQIVNNANNEADEEEGEDEADDERDEIDDYDSFNAETYSALDDDDDDLDDDDEDDNDDDDDENDNDITDNDINDHVINDNNIINNNINDNNITDNNINDIDNVANVNISNRLDISDEIRAMLIDGINENAEELPTEEYLDNLLNLNSDDSLENILIDGNTVNDSFISEHPFRHRRDSGTGGAGGGVGR